MGDLLVKVGFYLLDGAVKRLLSGAGLGLASATGIYLAIDKLINELISNLNNAPVLLLNFIGISGLDVAVSLVSGALLARATILQAQVFLVSK